MKSNKILDGFKESHSPNLSAVSNMSQVYDAHDLIHEIKGNIRTQKLILTEIIERIETGSPIGDALNEDMEKALLKAKVSWRELYLLIFKK